MAKKLLLIKLESFFRATHTSPYWESIKKLPIILRYILGLFLMLFGLLGMFTPLPAGIVFFLIGLALFIGLRRVRGWVLAFVHWTRLHILYGRVYIWIRKRR